MKENTIKILTEENTVYDLNNLSNVVDSLCFAVLDYSNLNDVDFRWQQLVFLDQYIRSAADLKIGKHRVQVPLDWSIVIADKNSGSLELLDLKHINDREFQVFCFNPIDGYMPSFPELEMADVFNDVSWTMPKLSNGHLLAVPIQDGPSPLCAFFVRETHRLPEALDITKIFQ